MKKLIVLGAAAALTIAGATQASTTKTTSTAGSTTKSSSSAGLSLDRTQIQLIQYALSDLGYRPGAIDGQWGKATKAALRSYQSDEGVRASGSLTTSQACYLMRAGIANHGSAGKLPGFCSSN